MSLSYWSIDSYVALLLVDGEAYRFAIGQLTVTSAIALLTICSHINRAYGAMQVFDESNIYVHQIKEGGVWILC